MATDVIFDYAERIRDSLDQGQIGLAGMVVFFDYVPTDIEGFTPNFAPDFGCEAGEEPEVRRALDYLERMGMHVTRKLISEAVTGDAKKHYPAIYEVTVCFDPCVPS